MSSDRGQRASGVQPSSMAKPGVQAQGTPHHLVHTDFEHHAASIPTNFAISDLHMGVQLTFEELNEKANRIASSILARVGASNGRVAIIIENDIEAIAGLLGTWKAGKAAVPLDTSNPRTRLELLLAHADVEAIVGGDAALAPDAAHIDLTDLDPETQNPAIVIDQDATARIMYTSGSTGVPKGVVQSHGFLIAKVANDRDVNSYDAFDRLSQMLPLGFAASTSHTLGALTNGGTLCIYDPNSVGLHNLEGWIKAERITCLQLAPALFRRFAEQLGKDVVFPTVRYVLVGGDRVLRHDVELFQRHFAQGSVFVNRFAATECGPISRLVVGQDDPIPSGTLPLGKPLPGRDLAIVDGHDNEVPRGQTGQILVRASDMSDGYWRDDVLTQASFGTTSDGAAFYRTGDLGRIDEDGNLEHAGRSNQRIKVGGFGVDLIEIENALLNHPDVREIAVVVSTSNDGENTIVAYVVPSGDTRVDGRSLRSYLASRLPRPSVPAGFVILDTLPLTPRGKVNKAELPPWTPEVAHSDSVDATTGLEADLVTMFEKAIGVSGVGTTDSFWDLGGTSIQALALFAIVSERFGQDLAPTALLAAPDVASLATLIESGGASDTNRVIVPIQTTGERTPLICIHGGGGGIFFTRDIAQYLPNDRPVYAVQAEGFEGAPPPYRSVEELADRYLLEITRVQPKGPYFVCGLSFGGLVAIEIARRFVANGQIVEFLGLIDTKYPGTKDDLDEGVGRHRTRMADLSLWKKVRYVVEGVGNRLVWRPLRRHRSRRFIDAGRPIPVKHGLRNWYFFSLHAKASRAYVPTPITTPIALLSEQGSAEDQKRAWERTASGGLMITEATADHHALIREPAVQEVAAWIRKHTDG